MQTRRKTRDAAATATAAALPHLPPELQALVVGALLDQLQEPDAQEYMLYPHRTSFTWLLSMRRVSKAWLHATSAHPAYARRCRLERLTRLVHAQFVHHVMAAARTKQQQQLLGSCRRSLQGRIDLPFVLPVAPSPPQPPKQAAATAHCAGCLSAPPLLRCTLRASAIGRRTPDEQRALPRSALLLTVCVSDLDGALLAALLADMADLDARHGTPVVLKLVEAGERQARQQAAAQTQQTPAQSDAQRTAQQAAADDAGAAPQLLLPSQPAPGPGVPAAAPTVVTAGVDAGGGASGCACAGVGAAGPAAPFCLQAAWDVFAGLGRLHAGINQEGAVAWGRLYFIPTAAGLRRRVRKPGA